MTKNNKNLGYTLIEVLIAMAIFSLGFLALATIQIKSITQNASAKMYTEATSLAVESLERLIALPYDHSDLNQGANPHSMTSGAYTIEWNIQNDTPVTATKTIVIEVTAANPLAKSITIQFVRGQSSYGRINWQDAGG
jgi:type IV pilus modification protein PilV